MIGKFNGLFLPANTVSQPLARGANEEQQR